MRKSTASFRVQPVVQLRCALAGLHLHARVGNQMLKQAPNTPGVAHLCCSSTAARAQPCGTYANVCTHPKKKFCTLSSVELVRLTAATAAEAADMSAKPMLVPHACWSCAGPISCRPLVAAVSLASKASGTRAIRSDSAVLASSTVCLRIDTYGRRQTVLLTAHPRRARLAGPSSSRRRALGTNHLWHSRSGCQLGEVVEERHRLIVLGLPVVGDGRACLQD